MTRYAYVDLDFERRRCLEWQEPFGLPDANADAPFLRVHVLAG